MTQTALPKIGAPAQRALEAIGVQSLEELTSHEEREIAALHGMGPKALTRVKEAMLARGISFAGGGAAGGGASGELAELLAPFPSELQQLALALRALVRELVPDAVEELDPSAKLIGFTYLPGTYKGLFAAVALHRAHVNLMFSKGVELQDVDTAGLLEGTGKRARHIRFTEPSRVTDPAVGALVRAAAQRTPRS